MREFDEPTAYIVKHTSPCGVASAASLAQAYVDALSATRSPPSAASSASTAKVERTTAQALLDGMAKYGFLDAHASRRTSPPEARELLAVKKNLRLLELPDLHAHDAYDFKRVTGGFVVQEPDRETDPKALNVVTALAPDRGATQRITLRLAGDEDDEVQCHRLC